MFSVRLVNADSYQATPLPQLDPTFSEFRGTEIKHVPIVRVFGTTHTGEKTCLHLHGVFPYLYVPFTGDDNADGLAYRLAASLDAAINISLGSANSNTQHVYQVQRVAGIPFYGYHRREHQFFKVSFYNPAIMKKAIDLLQNGSVLNQSFQPHEAHIPFILQFMMDYNLHGMSMINLSSVKYRRRITQSHSEFKSSNAGSSNSSSSSGGVATTGGIITPVDELDYLPACVERQSICELEVDGLVSDILNRQDLERGIELNPGLAAIWEEERARRAQAGLACEDSQLVNPKSPGRPPYCLTDNDLYQQQRFNRRLYMVSQCDESTLSSASSPSSSYSPASLNQSSYPIETLNDDQLMNASNLPSLNSQNLNLTQHINEISSLNSNKLSQESKTSQLTNETSILDSEDIPLIEILMDLARDSEKHGPVDNDSILGTQSSAFDQEEIKSDNEDDDVIDFNLTCLDIDSMSPWGSNPDKSPPSQLVPVNNIDLINNINNSSNNYNNNGNNNDNNNYNNPGSINTTETTNINRPIIGADTTDAESLNSEESQLPQLDGAGDLLSFLESEEDENIIKYEHQVKRIPEYQAPISTADYANRVRVFNTNLPCNDDEAFIMEEGTSSSNCSPMSQQDAWSFYLPTDADNIDEFVNMNFELLGSEFDSDYETTLGLNSLLEGDEDESTIGINLIVDNGNNECVPLEAVLNGDPCFTQTAEMDKSDLTELKDQYDSLLGSELVPIAYKNFRESDNCVDNNNTRLDSNDKCGQVYSNLQSQQLNNDNTSEEAASTTTGTTAITPPTNDTRNLSSENVTPNIQEPDGKVNTVKSKYDNCKEFNSSRELATAADSSDYNCNLVARWEELQDLKFIPKRVLKKKGFVRPRKQILRRATLSESMMARKRGYFRRGPANLANQVFTIDNNNINTTTTTTTVSTVPDNDNLPNNLIDNVTQDVNCKKDNTTICNNNRQIRATDRTGTTDKIKLFIENSRNVKNSNNTSTTTASSTCYNSTSTSKTRLSADTRATLASTTTTKTSSFGSGIKEKSTKSPCSLDDYSPRAPSNFSPSDLIGHVNTSTEVETFREYCNGEMDNLSGVVGNPDEVDNNPTDGEKTKIVYNKHQSRYLSYYSSVNAHSGVPYGQNKHRHCLYSSYRSAFVKDYVFTVDQVWVIDKRKRGTAPAISASLCTKDCCRLPIVLLDKLNIVINKSKPESKPKHTQANRDASSVVIDHVDNVNYTCDSSEIDMVNCHLNIKNIDKINTPAQLVNLYNNNNNNNNIINNNNLNNKKNYKDGNNIKKTNILLLNNNKSYDSTSTQSSQISSTQNHDQVTDNINKIITATATATTTTTTTIKQQEQQKNDGPVIIKRVFEEMSQDGTASKKKRSIILKLGNRSHSTVSIKDENKSNLDESFNENFVQPRGMKSKRRRLKKIKRLNEKVIANGINKESKIHNEKSTPHIFRSSKSSKSWSSIIDKPRLRSRVNNIVKSNNSNNQLMDNESTDACSVANGQLNLITSSQSEPIQSRKRPEIWCSISRKNIDLEFLTAKSLSSPVYKSDNVPVIRQKPIVIRHVETLPKTYKIKIYSPASNVKSVCESEVDTTSPEDSLITFQNNNTGNIIDNNSVVKNNNDKNIISNTSQVQQFSEFDTTLDVHLCDSIYKDEDDVTAVANEIFDTAAGGGGSSNGGGDGIVEEERISLVDCTANSSQESEQYTKAIAEANFYAGKNYTIDAISLEIPQCLFEEDSNSESLQKKSLETITESSMPEISVGILSPSHIPSSHSQETPAELDKLLNNNLINGLNDLNDSISSLTSITDKTVVKSQPMNEFVQPGDSFNSITSHKFNPRDHTSTKCNYVSSSSSSSSSSAFEFSTSAMLNNLPSEQLNFEDYFDEEQIIQMINSALILNDINLDDNTLNNQLLSLSKEDNICGDNNSKVDDEKTKAKYSPNKISIIRKIYKSKGDNNNKAEKSNIENVGTANQADENLLLNPKQGIDLVDIGADAPDNPVIIKPNNGIDLEFNEPMKIDGDDDNSVVNDNDKDAGGEEEKRKCKFTSTDSINTKAYENQESQNKIKSDCVVISQYKNLEKSFDNISSEIFNQNEKNEQQSVKTIPTVCDNENKVNVIDIEVIKLMDNILSLVSIEKSMNNMYNNGNVDNSIDTEPVLNSIVNNNLIDDKGCKAAGGRSNYLSQSNEISTTVTAVENNTDCNKFKGITDKFCSDNKNIIESLEAKGSDDHHVETEAKLTNEKTDVKLVEPEIKDKITTGTAGSYCEVVEVNEKVKSSVEQSTFESSIPITDNQCSNEQEIKLRFKEDYTEVVFNSDKENIDSHECSIYSNSIAEVEKDPEEVVRAEENKEEEEEEINGDGEEVQEDKLNIDTGSKSGVEQENNYIDDSNGKNISKESVFRCRELSVRLVRIKLNEFNQYLNSSNGCGNKSKTDVNSSLVEFESGGEAANPSSVKQKFVNSSGVKKCVRFDDQVFIFETNTRVPLINFDEKSEEEEEQRESFTEGDEGEGAVEPECQGEGEGEGETERLGTGEVESEGGCDEEEPEVLEEEEEEEAEAEPEPEPEIAEQEKKTGVENQELEKEKGQQVEKVKDGEKQDNKNIVDKDEIFGGCIKKCEITDSYKSIGNKNDSETKFNGDVIGSSCINKKHDDDIIVISDSDESSNSDNDVEFVSEEKLVPDSCVSKKLNSKIIDKNFVFTENNNGNTDKLSHVNLNGVIRNKNETSNDKKNKKYSKSTFKDINPIKDVPRIRSSSFGTVTVTLTPVTSTSTSTSTSTISDSCGSSASLPSKKSGKRVKELATKFTCVSGQNSSKSTKTEFNRDIKEQQQFSLDNIQEMESKLDKNLKDVTVLDESTIPVDKNIKEKSRLAVELLTKFSEKEPTRSSESTCKRKRNNNNNLPRQSYLNSNNIIKANSNSINVPSTVDPAPTGGSSSLLAASMVESRQNSDDNRLVRTYRMLTSYRTKIHTLSIDQRMVFTRVAVSDQEFGCKQAKEKFLEGIGLYPMKPQGCGWKPAHITTGFMQLQQPRVILQRLTPSVLKYYGYTRRFKSQRFGKRFKTDVNNRFTIPAYDGPADLSSTDSESDTDITLDCREKRVCDYKPRKHFKRREVVVTPRKRKNINSDEDTGGDKVNPGEEDLFQGARDRATQRLFNRPTTKHGMPLTDNKIYYQSPTRATTSRSPGLSGNYTPLKIVITSPKVRKLAHTSSDQPTIDNHNRTYSHSRAEDCLDNENSCVTPRRRRRLLSSTVTSTRPRGDSHQMLKANDERQQTD